MKQIKPFYYPVVDKCKIENIAEKFRNNIFLMLSFAPLLA